MLDHRHLAEFGHARTTGGPQQPFIDNVNLPDLAAYSNDVAVSVDGDIEGDVGAGYRFFRSKHLAPDFDGGFLMNDTRARSTRSLFKMADS